MNRLEMRPEFPSEHGSTIRDTMPAWIAGRARVVIIDRDPEKYRSAGNHFMSKEEVLETIAQSDFALDRVETFLSEHNIYVVRPKN